MSKRSKEKKGPRFKVLNLDVDPCQGMSRMAVSVRLPGYVFYKMTRKLGKAKIHFVREDLV